MKRPLWGLGLVGLLLFLPSCSGPFINQHPVAVMTANPQNGSAPLIVTFEISDSYDPDGKEIDIDLEERSRVFRSRGYLDFTLDFGDGKQVASGSDVTNPIIHTYISAGVFTAILTVIDRYGAIGRASVAITVTASTNQAPMVTITSPTDGSNFAQDTTITFTGEANDAEDGVLTEPWLVWTSSIDGQIATAESFTKDNLSVGTHTITLIATDSQGAAGSDQITVIISLGTAPTITGISPSSGAVHTPVTITGNMFGNMQRGSTIEFNGVVASVISWSDTSIVANVPVIPTPHGHGTAVAVVITVDGHASTSAPFTVIRGILYTYNWDSIFIMNPDGSQPTRLNSFFWDQYSSWSPDGTRIAFQSSGISNAGNIDIFIMEADGSNVTRLTTDPSDDLQPTFSPDGNRIAFVSKRDSGDAEIYVMDADGSNQERITFSSGFDMDPSWSPDGARIAFSSERAGHRGNLEIYVMDSDGSNPTRLISASCCNNDLEPTWSPDGSLIAFTSERDSGRDANLEIYLMNNDGSNQRNLTNHFALDDRPSWSPDGAEIVFRSNRAGGITHIFIINIDSFNVVQITSGVSFSHEDDPAWIN